MLPKSVLRVVRAEEQADLGSQGFQIHRFCDVGVESGLDGSFAVALHGEGGQGNDWYFPSSGGTNVLQDSKAVQARHLNIDQRQIWPMLVEPGDIITVPRNFL